MEGNPTNVSDRFAASAGAGTPVRRPSRVLARLTVMGRRAAPEKPAGTPWSPGSAFTLGTAKQHSKLAAGGVCHNPAGPDHSFNPREPHSQQRVTKCGSFLCAETSCLNDRPSVRRGTDYNTGMSHLGFRCVLSPDQRDSKTTETSTQKTANKTTNKP